MKLSITFLGHIVILIFLSGFESCNKENDSKCGCNAESIKVISNDTGVVYYSSLGPILISSSCGLSNVCDIPEDMKNKTINFSANLHSSCYPLNNPTDIQNFNYVSISEFIILDSTDSIFSIDSMKLEIIRSESYGYSKGFGYKITGGKFDILQQFIPSIKGYQPFKGRNDALRVGLLIAFKLRESLDFPSITNDELKLLGII